MISSKFPIGVAIIYKFPFWDVSFGIIRLFEMIPFKIKKIVELDYSATIFLNVYMLKQNKNYDIFI